MKELRRLKVAVVGIQKLSGLDRMFWIKMDILCYIQDALCLVMVNNYSEMKVWVLCLIRALLLAWKNAGECWETVSSRIVTARLQIIQHGHRRHRGSRWTSSRYLSLLSVYAPTAKATPSVKQSLLIIFDTLPAGDIVVVLGDFNTWIGKRDFEDDVWKEVRGLHGIGTCNEPSEQLLELCAVKILTIMNSWFKKKRYMGTPCY